MVKSIGALGISWLLSIIAWMILMMALLAVCSTIDPAHFSFPPTEKVPSPPNNIFWILSLVIDGVMALLAGVLVTQFSPSKPKLHLIILTAFFCAGTIATAFGEAGMLPEWVSWGRVVLVVFTMYGAGMWRISRKPAHNPLDSFISLQS